MASRVHPAYSAPFDPHESGYDIVTRPSGTRKWWARFVCGSSSKPAQSGTRLRIRRASLGVGGHSSVVTGSYGPKSVPVAVKVLSNADPHTMNELAAFRRLGISHRNVVEAHPAIISPHFKTVYLPLELCDTSLLALCHTRGGLEEIEAAAIFAGVVDGLTFLHSNGVYHQDVKPDNILLKNGTAKLADLGAAVLSFGNQDAAAGCVAGVYLSPRCSSSAL